MLVKKTTRILPPFEMPLPPAFRNIFQTQIPVSFFLLYNHGFCGVFEEIIGKERKKKEKEKEKSAKVQKITKIASHYFFAAKYFS